MDLLENPPLIYKKESFNIVGACMEVHKTLGCGFLEAVYQEALAIEFTKQNIPFKKEVKLTIYYKGIQLQKEYSADFVCYDSIIVEIKALNQLNNDHLSQTRCSEGYNKFRKMLIAMTSDPNTPHNSSLITHIFLPNIKCKKE